MADKGETEKFTINVKSTKHKLEIELEKSMLVADLKKAVEEKLGDDNKGELCLIFAGKILKDEDSLESHGIVKNDLTVHLVLRPPKTTPTGSTSTRSAPTGSAPPTTTHQSTSGTTTTTPSSSVPLLNPFGGMGQMPNQQAVMEQLMSNPELMAQIMESPLMQNLMANPDAFQSMFTSNPQIQQLMERNPELTHILNNPDLMRQALEMARNPAAMREMMRSQDRQLSNIESLPGGFNALARMYSEIQEPMMDAAQESLQQQLQDNPFAALFSGQQNTPSAGPATPQGQTNTEPLPNPWGGASNSSTASTRPTQGTTSSSSGGGGADPFAQMMNNPGLMGNMGGSPMAMMQDPAHRAMVQQMLQNPQMRQMTLQMMQNPQLMQQMMQNVPGMPQNINPEQMAQASATLMNNPQLLEALSNPEAMQASLNMMQSYQQLMGALGPNAAGLMGGPTPNTTSSTTPTSSSTAGNVPTTGNPVPTAGNPVPTAGNPMSGAPNAALMMQLFQQMSTGGTAPAGGTGGGGPPPVVMPSSANQQEQEAARRYRIQMDRLEAMGFIDRIANAQALIATAGDINAAIDRLLNS